MKRKMTVGLIVASLLVLGLVVTAFAQTGGPAYGAQNGAQTCLSGEWIDADGDGVCDNMGTATGLAQGHRWGDTDDMGSGGAQGMMAGRRGNMQAMRGSMGARGMTGPGYMDADDDGVCDHFVDADNDGQCDGCGAGANSWDSQQSNGMQRGMQARGRGAGAGR